MIREHNGKENINKTNRFRRQNNKFVRVLHFFLFFFAVFAQLRCETAKFYILWRA